MNSKREYGQCSLCGDRGIVIKNDLATQCKCVKQKSLLNQFKFANISKQMIDFNFRSFDFNYYSSVLVDPLTNRYTFRQLAELAYQAAQKFVQDILENKENSGMMLSGPVGSGKTFLAACIANSLLENQREVLFTVVPDLLDEIKETFNKNSEHTELQLMNRLRDVHILILDDLGAHNYNLWTQNKIYSIINYRLNHKLPTIITTNLNLEEIDELLGERTTSRIVQMCKVYRITVEKDIRHIKHLTTKRA